MMPSLTWLTLVSVLPCFVNIDATNNPFVFLFAKPDVEESMMTLTCRLWSYHDVDVAPGDDITMSILKTALF